MNLLAMLNPISTAYADAAPGAATPSTSSPWGTVIMLVIFFIIFYFLLIRPQSKRAKEQRALLAGLGKGDEVMTSGGIMGKVTEIEDNIVSIEIANNVVIKVQKPSITATLPKGTLK